jgi:hypothetical protein
MNKIHWQDVITLIIGLWIIASAFFLGPTLAEGEAFPMSGWNFLATGAVAVILGGAALFSFQKWEEWLTALVGAWLVLSPWVLGYATETTLVWNAIVSGGILVVMGLWTSFEESESAIF